ncbi:inositol monophosphatase family protein [Alkalicoccobacillus plakortidis]|uniref:Inositol monophosphatase family protein n=1 Tax=Alkalicoccobacillus plakortidis TaxID=444060 RepID=A0ABT0XI30_9BACI|nr:inositol monophosphatase family protein [Alkalicoccobacillus plakortidis]MCM2674862.1 inositol monophosphatase family protein [Alkalicoccobacillus plakortidis]
MADWNELGKVARKWTYEAAEQIKRALANPFKVEAKSGPDDLVTEVDKNTEAFFYQKIKETYPDHSFLGEEGTAEKIHSTDGIVWIIDPIDGTMNFVQQKIKFAISIGIFEDGVGKVGLVYDVMADEMFYAVQGQGAYVNQLELVAGKERPLNESIVGLNARWLAETNHPHANPLMALVRDSRSVRSYGSAAIEMAYVAADRLDAYVSVNLSPWDYAGASVLLEEMGYCTSSFSGKALSLLEGGTVIAAKQHYKEKLYLLM